MYSNLINRLSKCVNIFYLGQIFIAVRLLLRLKQAVVTCRSLFGLSRKRVVALIGLYKPHVIKINLI
jgi:hypothetical protein